MDRWVEAVLYLRLVPTCGVHLCTVAVEWDPRKAASNARKHGVRFADAMFVLEDELAITIGMDGLARVLTVVYTWRGEDV